MNIYHFLLYIMGKWNYNVFFGHMKPSVMNFVVIYELYFYIYIIIHKIKNDELAIVVVVAVVEILIFNDHYDFFFLCVG